MKKTIRLMVMLPYLTAMIIMMSCNSSQRNDEINDIATEEPAEENNPSREIDTSYTPQTLVETFYSMLTFRDHKGAIELFEYAVGKSEYELEYNAEQNKNFLNRHTPISYEVTDVEYSPDSSRAKITAILQMTDGENRTVHHNAIKTKNYGWRLLEGINTENNWRKKLNEDERKRDEFGSNTKWKFKDNNGDNYVIEIKEDRSAILYRNNNLVAYGSFSLESGYDNESKWVLEGDGFDVFDKSTGIAFTKDVQRMYFCRLDITNGFLYYDHKGYTSKDPNRRLKVTRIK